MSGLNILLVDDHALFRSGMCFLLLDLDQDIEVIEAETCAQALELGNDNTSLILLDFHLPDGDGDFSALQKIKQHYSSAQVVVLSSEDDPSIIHGAVELGAAGFIPKSSTPSIMIAALKLILAGGVYLPPMAYSSNVAKNTTFVKRDEQSADISLDQKIVSQLSGRQLEVLIGAIKGKPNKVIARELNIAEGTVKTHLSVAFRVLEVKNRTEAVYMAAKLNLGF